MLWTDGVTAPGSRAAIIAATLDGACGFIAQSGMKLDARSRKALKNTAIGFTLISALCWAILGALVLMDGSQSAEGDKIMVLVGKGAFYTWLLSLSAAVWVVTVEVKRSRQVLLDEENNR